MAAIVGATVVLVDVSRDTMLMDLDEAEAAITEKTRVIIPVSVFGNPLDYDRLSRIRDQYGIHVVEDAACSIGAEYKGDKVGNQADISVFSLHPRKFITTGEGGLITTNNTEWADWMMSYKHFGMGVHESRLSADFVRIGTNYKLSNILAAVGLGQMQKIDDLLARRRSLAMNYMTLLDGRRDVCIPATTPGGEHSFQSFCVFVRNRDKILRRMRGKGIEVQIGTYALHLHKAFASGEFCRLQGDLSGSRYAFDHSLVLPLFHELTFEEQAYVVENLIEEIERAES